MKKVARAVSPPPIKARRCVNCDHWMPTERPSYRARCALRVGMLVASTSPGYLCGEWRAFGRVFDADALREGDGGEAPTTQEPKQ